MVLEDEIPDKKAEIRGNIKRGIDLLENTLINGSC